MFISHAVEGTLSLLAKQELCILRRQLLGGLAAGIIATTSTVTSDDGSFFALKELVHALLNRVPYDIFVDKSWFCLAYPMYAANRLHLNAWSVEHTAYITQRELMLIMAVISGIEYHVLRKSSTRAFVTAI